MIFECTFFMTRATHKVMSIASNMTTWKHWAINLLLILPWIWLLNWMDWFFKKLNGLILPQFMIWLIQEVSTYYCVSWWKLPFWSREKYRSAALETCKLETFLQANQPNGDIVCNCLEYWANKFPSFPLYLHSLHWLIVADRHCLFS